MVLRFILITLIISSFACTSSLDRELKRLSSDDPKKTNEPNVLVILTDDQGYYDVSYYNTPDIRTPHIDALTADGMRFDNFYANCPVCSPTRAALLTGRYPDRVGVPGVIRTHAEDNWGYLDESARMLPEAFNSLGYHTALVGKWHLGLSAPNIPTERGFDFFHGWLGDMMDDYWKKRRHGINYMRRNLEVIDPPGHATDIFTDWAIEYLEERSEGDQPFFLYLSYNAPHFPVQPPDDWLEKVKNREPRLSEKRAKLVAFIEHLDDGIGKVIKKLKDLDQYDNTIIVFTSDNGGLIWDEANNGPLRDGKQSMYEGGLKVPTSVVWKDGGIVEGSSTDYNCLTMDLYPTLIDAVSEKPASTYESQSFLPVLKGQMMDDGDRPLYFVRREGGMRYGGLTIQALRLGDWKILQNSPFAPQELYNLKTDPGEEHDLRETEPEKFKEMNALLMQHVQEGGKIPWQVQSQNE